jgi:hypothetical protein
MELHRVHSVKQTSMAATSLPLELQQQIFTFLDPRSFNAARSVCRYWHFASQSSRSSYESYRSFHNPMLASQTQANS